MKRIFAFAIAAAMAAPMFALGGEPPPEKRIVFLGDSITQAGRYIEIVEAALVAQYPESNKAIIPLGLSSETVSGLSEPGHAGGKFPRPDLHERLDRVLAKAKPDLVIACYGMNDGIYHPLDAKRTQAFRDGMIKLHEKVTATGARIIHLTPPVFDPVPIKAQVLPAGLETYKKPFEGYNGVLDAYSQWLLEMRSEKKWEVLDVHGAMNAALAEKRKTDPQFTFAKDGVHPSADGQLVIARVLLDAWGLKVKPDGTPDCESGSQILQSIQKKQAILKLAWLSHVGHKRPGVAAGLPMEEAEKKAAAFDTEARNLAKPKDSPASKCDSPSKPVLVFILAGQSNMEGHGFVAADPKRNGGKGSLEFAVKDPATAKKFAHLADKEGKWKSRDDVFISYLERSGPLTAGFGVNKDKIGPELGFGWVMGDACEQPILLIKCAWGGKSLSVDFRPPSSGKVPYSLGEKQDAAIAADPKILGKYYRETISIVKATLPKVKELVPGSDGKYELAGFGWHQGWNDRISDKFNAEYEANMVNFIRDVRKDLGAPALPFVIAETGMNGPEEKNVRALSLMKAQASAAAKPEFKGSVAFVPTQAMWRTQEQSPSGQGYHWNTNGETYYLIGEAMGEAMKELRKAK